MIPYRKGPCRDCPFRQDATGVRKAYSNLADYAAGTIGQPGNEAPLGAEMFACHMSVTSPSELCAGWLAVAGVEHLTVRLTIAMGELPGSVLKPGPGWPLLFPSAEAMITANQAALEGKTP